MLAESLAKAARMAAPGLRISPCRAAWFRGLHTSGTRPTSGSWSSSRMHCAAPSDRRIVFTRSYNAFVSRSRPTLAKAVPRSTFRAHASTNAAPNLPTLSPPSVGRWLLLSSGLVFAVIVVGGVTRLTESGLSITEWKPITGILPPLSQADWMEEFEKYQATPEFKMLNHSFTLDEFKRIFYMEWGHRVLGRVIGLAFVLPLTYFAARRMLARGLPLRLFGLASLIGVQGAIGWYMVKSGLEESLMETPGAVPRVSQYRLAAHLGAAFVLYAGMFYTGLSITKDWAFAKGKAPDLRALLNHAYARRLKTSATLLTGLVFLTALSGAFVAGLDAGLLYNEFPLMGGQLVPPTGDLFSPAYAKSNSDIWWRNILENPTTVQFDHRVLATVTYFSTAALWATMMLSHRARRVLPAASKRMLHSSFAMVNIQAALGISTLLYLVPVPLAAAHQAGSVALLTTFIHLLVTLRQPSKAAIAWRAALVRAGAKPPVAALPSNVIEREVAKVGAKKSKPMAPRTPALTTKHAALAKAGTTKPSSAKATPPKPAAMGATIKKSTTTKAAMMNAAAVNATLAKSGQKGTSTRASWSDGPAATKPTSVRTATKNRKRKSS